MYTQWMKRCIDFSFALLFLILLFPFLLLIGLVIRLDSKGPVIFRQERIGRGGAVFWMYKFRSMSFNTECTGSGAYCFKNDPRVTRVGRFIRKTSLDELPQLVNIIKGEMSFVGPRPTLTYHPWAFAEYTEEQRHRFDVLPGITGLAQIKGRKNLPWPERIALDVQYTRHITLWSDLSIVLRTAYCVFVMKDNVNQTQTVTTVQVGPVPMRDHLVREYHSSEMSSGF